MQTLPTAHDLAALAALRRAIHRFRVQNDADLFVMVGLPLLIFLGTVLGLINLFALIHLMALLLNAGS